MSLPVGSRLGSYEILATLGAGGMGEVYRARDTRLSREVAVKVLPAELALDPGRLRRFEKEAQSASGLNHPNIVTIYDVGKEETISWIAMELVPGQTLRELLAAGPLSLRRLLGISAQVVDGLARAHEAGIVHRDLKPENVMVTKDGLVKILDFGLAKLALPAVDGGQPTEMPTVSAGTTPGIVMGTVGYMSPEQASGHPVDFRSDQFSFGSIVYELATGKPAFKRATAAQTLAAIIQEEPEPMTAAAPKTPAPLRWIVDRCMAKESRGRYAATEDLARELAALRDHWSELSTSAGVEIESLHRRPRWREIGAVFAVLLALAGMFFLGRRIERSRASSPRFRQLTFRGAGIGTARFASDGQSVVFSAQAEGKPPELLALRLDSPETRSLGLPPAQVLSISPSGEMAILLQPAYSLGPRIGHIAFENVTERDPLLLDGTLADASISGGAPRELLEDVTFADWTPNGKDLAVVHRVGNRYRLESPIGTAIYEAEEELLNHPRFPSRESRLAFKDWGSLFLTEGGGVAHRVPGVEAALEIAWVEATGEIWYTIGQGTDLLGSTELHAITTAGRDRLVAALPGNLILYDIAPDGRVLFGRHVETSEIHGTFPEDPRERNLSYFDGSGVVDLSATGDTLLFGDVFRGAAGAAYLRTSGGSAPKRLGEMGSLALSPDGRFVLTEEGEGAAPVSVHRCCVLVPTGPGQPTRLDNQGVGLVFVEENRTRFNSDGSRIFYTGYVKGHGPRVWVQDIHGGKPRALTPEGVRRSVPVGDGHLVCARAADSAWYLYPTEAGEPRKVVGLLPGEEPIQSTPDGLLYVRGADELRPGESLMTTRVYRLDPRSGRRELWKEIPPENPRTGGAISSIRFSDDGKTCVWTHIRYSTELLLVEGLK